MDWELVLRSARELVHGIDETVLLLAGAISAGFVLAIAAAVASLSGNPILRL